MLTPHPTARRALLETFPKVLFTQSLSTPEVEDREEVTRDRGRGHDC